MSRDRGSVGGGGDAQGGRRELGDAWPWLRGEKGVVSFGTEEE